MSAIDTRTRAEQQPGVRRARVTWVMIVEDERLMRELLAEVIDGEPDLRVAGVAGCVAEVVAYRGRPPDVVLMDFRLPDGTGAEATQIVKARWRATRVVMLSAIHDDETVLEAIQAGADGYLGKDRAATEIVAAVRAVRAGEALLPSALIIEIARRVAAGRGAAVAVHRVELLTAREREILREIASGRPSRDICERLEMSPNTLRTHVQHILSKLGAHSKLQAVAVALRYGLVPSPREAEPVAAPVAPSAGRAPAG